jgi:hypothetical protein
MRINVEVTYADTGKYAVHTQRFFRKIDVDTVYAIRCLSPARDPQDIAKQVVEAAVAAHAGRGIRLVVLPHACNMPEGAHDDMQYDLAEPFPTAGRTSGPFLSVMREAARSAGLWICCGVALRVTSVTPGAKQARDAFMLYRAFVS